ncbi:hypothetical protein LTR37_005810 [Vermiconidia calcicola]|uniref:Uncharacterized protein n=1 Tax=Vermiconidia calcicola TaxID=1690605 RepID=A0ACC3NJ59_9PEZI|nr:hypothetical protein LTR37_005810 [Vermiconidia calcicola]
MVTIYRHIPVLPVKLFKDLARAHRYFSNQGKANGPHPLTGEQVAIQTFCTMIIGVEGWEIFLEEMGEEKEPAFTQKEIEDARVKGYRIQGDVRKQKAVNLVEGVVTQLEDIDAELANILHWVFFDALGLEAATT